MSNSLDPGDVRVGHIFDDVDDGFPDQVATLTLDDIHGPVLTIPYLYESEGGANPQYKKARQWFEDDQHRPPENLVFMDNRGAVTFCGSRSLGASMGSTGTGRLAARSVIFGSPQRISEANFSQELRSTIDGLREFADFSPIVVSDETILDGRRRLVVVLKEDEGVTWEYGPFKYKISQNVYRRELRGSSFSLDAGNPRLSTASELPHSIDDHLNAHRSIRALLTLIYGRKLAWRSHQILNENFPLRTLDGMDHRATPTEVHISSTQREHRLPEPRSSSLAFPMVTIWELGAEGLEKWSRLYSDEEFLRAVQPAVEVFNDATRFLDPQLMMLAISLDRLGFYQAGSKGKPSLARNILTCIEAADLGWAAVGKSLGIARAIARANNDLKHPDRNAYPSTVALAGLVSIAKVIVRAQLFPLLNISPVAREKFMKGADVLNSGSVFVKSGLTISDTGEISDAS